MGPRFNIYDFWINFWSNYLFFCDCILQVLRYSCATGSLPFLVGWQLIYHQVCLNQRANTLVIKENYERELGSLSKFWWPLTIMFLFFCIFHLFWWSQALRKAAATWTNLRIVGFFLNLKMVQIPFLILWQYRSALLEFLFRLQTSSCTAFSHSQYVQPLSQWGLIMYGAYCNANK